VPFVLKGLHLLISLLLPFSSKPQNNLFFSLP